MRFFGYSHWTPIPVQKENASRTHNCFFKQALDIVPEII